MEKTINWLGWVGAAAMLAFSFTMLIPLALVGLALLTGQAIYSKMWNLVGLNIASIIGYSLHFA